MTKFTQDMDIDGTKARLTVDTDAQWIRFDPVLGRPTVLPFSWIMNRGWVIPRPETADEIIAKMVDAEPDRTA